MRRPRSASWPNARPATNVPSVRWTCPERRVPGGWCGVESDAAEGIRSIRLRGLTHRPSARLEGRTRWRLPGASTRTRACDRRAAGHRTGACFAALTTIVGTPQSRRGLQPRPRQRVLTMNGGLASRRLHLCGVRRSDWPVTIWITPTLPARAPASRCTSPRGLASARAPEQLQHPVDSTSETSRRTKKGKARRRPEACNERHRPTNTRAAAPPRTRVPRVVLWVHGATLEHGEAIACVGDRVEVLTVRA